MAIRSRLLNATAFSSAAVAQAAKLPEFTRENGQVRIRQDVDRRYRAALYDLACAIEGADGAIAEEVRRILTRGPSRGGMKEAQQRLGDDLHPLLLRTVPLVEYLDSQCKGMKRWLDLTGFGNDVNLVKVFVEWADLGWNRHTIGEAK